VTRLSADTIFSSSNTADIPPRRLTGIDHAFAVAEVAGQNELLALVTGLPHGTSRLTSDASFRA
jgi:hypothetical protein